MKRALASAITALAFSIAALMAQNQPRLTAEGVTWVKGKFAGALQLEGGDAYLDCGKNRNYDLTGPITIEAWVKRLGRAPWCRIVAKGCDKSYAIDTGSTGDSVRFVLMDPAGVAFVNLQANQVLPQNTWTHVAATYDGKGLAMIYINGKESKRAKVATHGIRVVDAPLCIGNDGEDNSLGFEGLIDEVRISKSCRQAFELSKENVADADTVLLLHLNEARAAVKPNFQAPFSIELIGDPHGERGVKLRSVNPGPAG